MCQVHSTLLEDKEAMFSFSGKHKLTIETGKFSDKYQMQNNSFLRNKNRAMPTRCGQLGTKLALDRFP